MQHGYHGVVDDGERVFPWSWETLKILLHNFANFLRFFLPPSAQHKAGEAVVCVVTTRHGSIMYLPVVRQQATLQINSV